MFSSVPLAAANVPVWAAIVIAIGGAAIGVLGRQRAAERGWQAERRKLYAAFYALLFRLKSGESPEVERVKETYLKCYSDVLFAAKERHLRRWVGDLGPEPPSPALTDDDLKRLHAGSITIYGPTSAGYRDCADISGLRRFERRLRPSFGTRPRRSLPASSCARA